MASSGTVGQTTTDIATIIDHAWRRTGKLVSTVSGELILSTRENLHFLLSDLANRGLSLWCIQKYVLALQPGVAVCNLPGGTVDLLNALYRDSVELAGAVTVGINFVVIDLVDPKPVLNVSVNFDAAVSAEFILEASSDQATWEFIDSFKIDAPAKFPVSEDVLFPKPYRYWRLRRVIGLLGTYSHIRFNSASVEIPLSNMNRDDYVNMPNKNSSSASRPLQYWYDKQVNPRIWVWPIPSNDKSQIVIWTQRQIQDVGLLSGSVDVPQRWLESVIFSLACRCAIEMPAGELPPGRLEYLEAKALEHLTRAEYGESDGSPIKLRPNIRRYTR